MDATKTVLNVDDHAPARFLRTRILQRAGYGVDEEDSAAGAISRAPGSSLLLLDVGLPDGDGFSVCERVKASTPSLPIVMVTSVYRTAQARRDGFAAGADAFLLEPVAAGQLVSVVESLLLRGVTPARAVEDVWIVTDAIGDIADLSEPAAALLNLSRRGARGRSLPAFFTDNRPKLLNEVLRASEGVIIDRVSTLQPRDRRSVRVHIDVAALPHGPGDRVQLRWVLSPESR